MKLTLLLPILGLMFVASVSAETLPLTLQSEMQLLLADKYAASGSEGKLDSGLRHALQRLRGEGAAARLPRLRVMVPDALGRLHVDVLLNDAYDMKALGETLAAQPEAVIESASGRELRAWLRWQDVTVIAAVKGVRSVRLAMPAISARMQPPSAAPANDRPRSKAANISEGVRTHRVDVARAALGLTGLGQKICVLSDSIDFLGQVQASGDLPGDIDILPGQSGLGLDFSGEGTAMLELVHDLAPDARLGFARALSGVANFAQNLRDLRFVADCDVIVDDIIYFNESPFQDGPIAQAVNEVIADGALYFSSAGNEGNLINQTSSVYEGDFVDGGTLAALPGGSVNQFTVATIGSSNQQRLLSPGFGASLHWSDPLGASGNDYDVFVLSPDLQHVLDAGTNVQNGDDNPFEITGLIFPDDRIVVWKANAAAPRHLHLNTLRGVLNLGTGGQTHGHSAAVGAYSVAAVNVFTASGGAFVGGAANPAEAFSSDGPRRMFYASNGALLNTENSSLLGDGGVVRSKPDIAAADGSVTATPGFPQFLGTSAAAPHAAAIMALLRQAAPAATSAQLRSALIASALDIESTGVDAVSGVGIVMADTALAAIGAVPVARLQRGDFTLTAVDGDADALPEPGETFDLNVRLLNPGAATARAVQLSISSVTPDVELIRANVAYPDLAPAESALGLLPFRLRLAPGYLCGTAIDLQLQANFGGGSPGIATLALPALRLPIGALGSVSEHIYSGGTVDIPDNDSNGIVFNLPVNAAGVRIGDLDLSFTGTPCSADPLFTNAGLKHTFIGDLAITLQSPAGRTVQLVDRPRAGVGDNRGNHLCQTVFDDDASPALADASATAEPFSGSFRAVEPLGIFNGDAANGTWQLRISDQAAGDIGQLRAFRIALRPALCTIFTPQLLHADGFE